MPDLETSRAKLLGVLEGAKDITLIRSFGNLGDQLLHAGMRQLLGDTPYREVGLLNLTDDVKGDLAIVTGGGAWCTAHNHMPPYLPRLEKQFERVVIFPSSFEIAMPSVREALTASRAMVFARELASLDQIQHLCNADLAHDTAFFFDYAPYRRPGQGTLHAFRTDRESAHRTLPPNNFDVSAMCDSLDEFLRTIARYDTVFTDRAHVMIAAAHLGKQVFYAPSCYHKVPAIADACLRDYPVFAMPRECPREVWDAAYRMAQMYEASLPEDFAVRHTSCDVTVVLLSQDSFAETRRALRAIQERVRIPYRMLLFDNGSSAPTRTKLRELAAADPRIELIESPVNLSCAGGRAAAFERVTTDYVLLVDNDLEVLPGAVEHLLHCLEQRPSTVAATGRVLLPTGLVHLCGGEFHVAGNVLHQELLGQGQRFDEDLGASGPCGWVPGCMTLIRTATLRRHPFDPGMAAYYDDTEWCFRVHQAGDADFYRCVEALGIHYHEPKHPSAHLPTAARRSHALPFLKTLAHLYQQHGLVADSLPLFVPELAALGDRLAMAVGRLLLEMINARGSDWLLREWNAGAFDPLFEAPAPVKIDTSEQDRLEHERRMHELREHIAERNDCIASLRKVAEEKARQNGDLSRRIAEQSVELDERYRRLESLYALVAERDRLLQDIHGSLAFRVVKSWWSVRNAATGIMRRLLGRGSKT